MSFVMLPPEINSARMFLGAGSAPMLDAAAAWDTLSAELELAGRAFSTLTSDLAAQAWQGPASQAMLAAAAPYSGWLATAAGQAAGAAAQAQSVAGAFESALAATVHPAIVQANRSNFISLVLSNLFGQNASAIAAAEFQYEELWAQDVAAMVAYHGEASAAVAQLVSPAAALPDLGYGNIGESNIGFFNTGTLNVGVANISPFFTPTDPITSFGGVGIANHGLEQLGILNTGFQNVGLANTGTLNLGAFNTGTANSGLPLSLLQTLGIGNTGTYNQGLFNTGNHNLGIGLTGDNLIGVGPLHLPNSALGGLAASAASALPTFGYLNIGEGNIGVLNTGTLNVGFGNTSPFFTPSDPITVFGGIGIANDGIQQVGLLNTGLQNVGAFNNGTLNLGLVNTGIGNAGLPVGPLQLFGIGNDGNYNQGLFNTGNHNIGIGLTGDNLIGIGPLHVSYQ